MARRDGVNEYEFKVVWALSELGNVKWWHRNISRLGFQINGPVHAYPDIIVMLHSGKILMVETKGDHLDNDESKEKAKIGDQWAKLAGKQYKYYMVFETKQPDYPGAYSLERFMDTSGFTFAFNSLSASRCPILLFPFDTLVVFLLSSNVF